MLATWLRLKFPNVIDGAIAASAPIVQFTNRKDLDLEKYFNYSTIAYTKDDCHKKIRETFRRIDNIYHSGT